MALPHDEGAPLVAYVNRLTYQKMADVVLDALPRLVADGVQIVVHGDGDRSFEERFSSVARAHPASVAVRLGYNEAQAHRIIGGCDLSLTPARFEPCGLTTLYAMRYGAVPVTRAVGGLVDTVEDAGVVRAESHGGSGFKFGEATADDLGQCLARATSWYRDNNAWKRLQRRAMRRDFSWERSAQRYLETYTALLGERAQEPAIDHWSPVEDRILPAAACSASGP
jgi:starch synthase